MITLRRLLFGGLVMASLSSVLAEPYWPDFYDMAESQQEAENTSLKSGDIKKLQKAGVFFFALVNGVNGVKVESGKKIQEANSIKAAEYFDAAFILDKKNPMIATWRATATLSRGGKSRNLARKIKYADAGISYFNRIPLSERDNLDYLIMRIISFSQVPVSFRDLTESIKKDADKYMRLYDSLESTLPQHEYLYETAKVMKAKAFYETKDKDMARDILKEVDEQKFLKGQNDDTASGEIYYFLKNKLKV